VPAVAAVLNSCTTEVHEPPTTTTTTTTHQTTTTAPLAPSGTTAVRSGGGY
jgi:hypothetical protein